MTFSVFVFVHNTEMYFAVLKEKKKPESIVFAFLWVASRYLIMYQLLVKFIFQISLKKKKNFICLFVAQYV